MAQLSDLPDETLEKILVQLWLQPSLLNISKRFNRIMAPIVYADPVRYLWCTRKRRKYQDFIVSIRKNLALARYIRVFPLWHSTTTFHHVLPASLVDALVQVTKLSLMVSLVEDQVPEESLYPLLSRVESLHLQHGWDGDTVEAENLDDWLVRMPLLESLGGSSESRIFNGVLEQLPKTLRQLHLPVDFQEGTAILYEDTLKKVPHLKHLRLDERYFLDQAALCDSITSNCPDLETLEVTYLSTGSIRPATPDNQGLYLTEWENDVEGDTCILSLPVPTLCISEIKDPVRFLETMSRFDAPAITHIVLNVSKQVIRRWGKIEAALTQQLEKFIRRESGMTSLKSLSGNMVRLLAGQEGWKRSQDMAESEGLELIRDYQ